MGKKKPKTSNKPKSMVQVTKIKDNDNNLKISFADLDLNNKKYSLSELTDNKTKSQFYEDLIGKLHEYSNIKDFKKHISTEHWYRNSNHIHPINWTDNRIRENSFTSLDEEKMRQIKEECWQLGINNQGFRIHGYFIENIFYVVWFDPNHNMYERK